ncbi:MAG: hypothetical protein CL596_09760 [Alteromonas sp.]|nr:hypothetical protein [Alteromonas sp.]
MLLRVKLLFLFCFSATAVLFSQIGNETPIGWQLDIDGVPVVALPPLDLTAIIAEDRINDLDKTLPWRYGMERPLNLNVLQQGQEIQMANGDKLWRIIIRSENALNLSLNFSNFSIPEGAHFQFYNVDRADQSKVYNATTNRDSQVLGSWFVSGDEMIVEYYQPKGVNASAKLQLGSIIHGYRMGRVHQWAEGYRGLEDSGDCNYDVNCSVGSDFEEKKNLLKRAVALLNLGNGKLCTASLINNTSQDKTPYLLTANHCLEGASPNLWSVRFNWMSQNPICGNEGESDNIQANFTMSGALLRAHNWESDFALVELYNPVPDSWDVVFAGWDRKDENPLYQIGIHHPSGDVMKVCRDNDPAVKDVANGTQVWLIKGLSSGSGDGWDFGTTESGSSGSPLFNEKGKIIGQLYAGLSLCNGTENNREFDIYGRFAASWDGVDSSSRLKDWLDPSGLGLLELSSKENSLSIGEVEVESQLMIYPNPVSSYVTIVNTQYPNLTYAFMDVNGKVIQRGSMSNSENRLDVTPYASGIYFLRLLDEDTQNTIVKKIIVRR